MLRDARDARDAKRKAKLPSNVCLVVEDSNDESSLSYRKGTHANVQKSCTCMCMLELGSVWFINQRQFGGTLVETDIMGWPSKSICSGGFEIGKRKLVQVDDDAEE